MAQEVEKFNVVKRSYLITKEQGNHYEEARWANMIGDILKNKGEYVEALKWLRLNYDVTYRYLHDKQLLPTCQSLGGVYLRFQDFMNTLSS